MTPIPGLRTNSERFPKIGDIRKGAKKTEEKKPGKDLTFFRYAPIEGEETAAGLFHEAFTDEPREIVVYLPFNDIERNLEVFMERHTAGALQCRGDIEGAGAFMWRDNGTMRREHKACPEKPCEGCKETGRLKVIIPALKRYAYVEVHTTSKWDIIELYGNLAAIREAEGQINSIPLVLKRRPREVSTPRGSGKRVRQKKWLLSLEVAPRYVEEKLARLHNGDAPTAQLPAQVEEVTGEICTEEIDLLAEMAEQGLGATVISDEINEALNYATPHGRKLGEFTQEELADAIAQIDELTRPSGRMRDMRKHAAVLLEVEA